MSWEGERPLLINQIEEIPDLAGAFDVASKFYKLIIKYENVKLALMEVDIDPDEPESVLRLDKFLKIGALKGSGLQDSDPQIRTINQVRELLESFLPEEKQGKDDGLKHAGRIRRKDSRGRKWTDEGWNQED